MFNGKILIRGYETGSQSPLDSKGYFVNIADMRDVSNFKPLTWFKTMRGIDLETAKTYEWIESVEGVIVGGYTYPDNVVSFGIIYSLKTYNFLERVNSLKVTINGNDFKLLKFPGNILNSLEINDFVINGFWDSAEIWTKAKYIGGDKDLKASWNIVEYMEL
jgi:hypothetical protein